MEDILTLEQYSLILDREGRKLKIISSADMHIRQGEIVALIGESGSGKSMLWKSMLGLVEPGIWQAQGQVTLNGRRIDSLKGETLLNVRGKDVAVILQDPMNAFDQVFTIERHFMETAKTNKDWSGQEVRTRACQLLRRLYIREPEKVLKMYPFQCSGGMLQRIMIAMAMMLDTPLIIADEPTTSVDVSIQREIIAMLKEVNRRQNTGILFISHDLKLVENLADRVYVMYAGHLMESFPVAALREGKVEHPYTRKLLQSRPSYTRDYLPVLEGNPPAPEEAWPGCPFAPRCDEAGEECRTFDMRESEAGDQHTIRCCRHAVLQVDEAAGGRS